MSEVAAFKDRRFGGVVTSVNPALDVDSRSATVEAEIENTGNLLRSGMFGTARITREGASEGIFVAKSAILYDQATQNYRAFVIQEGVAKLRVLKLGIEENEETQVLEGLAAGEVVANSNLPQLFEGAKVVF